MPRQSRSHPGLVEHALQLHALGLRLVPLTGKRALLRDWPDLHLQERDIRSWTRRGANWGIVTGDPLVVIDTDSEEAEDWLRVIGIQSTTVVRSGGGGFHHYFRCMDGTEIRSRSALHGIRGLDVKGWHSYIVAAGSIHPDTGVTYTYEPGKELVALHALPVFRPQWIASARRKPEPELRDHSPPPRGGRINDIFAYLLTVESVQGNAGSNGCYRACCLLRDEGYDPDEAWPILLWWNERKPVPPWSISELIHKLESVYRRPLPALRNG